MKIVMGIFIVVGLCLIGLGLFMLLAAIFAKEVDGRLRFANQTITSRGGSGILGVVLIMFGALFLYGAKELM